MNTANFQCGDRIIVYENNSKPVYAGNFVRIVNTDISIYLILSGCQSWRRGKWLRSIKGNTRINIYHQSNSLLIVNRSLLLRTIHDLISI